MAELSGKQILMIVGQKNYDVQEFEKLRAKLSEMGADISIATNSMEKALGRLNGYVAPDMPIAEVDASEFDAAVVIGGYGARLYLWDDQNAHHLLQQFAGAGKVVSAISSGPVVLANAGVLTNHRATVYPDYESILILEEKGAQYVPESVLTDDNIITASHARFAEAFAEAIKEKLKG